VGGGGYRGGGIGGGGYRGVGGYRGYYGGSRGWGFRGYYGGYYGGYYPYLYSGFGLGYGYWPGYYDYGYGYGSYADYSYPDYSYQDYSYPAYQPSSNVTVVYPQQQSSPVYVERPSPVMREYDQYGQQVSGPPAGASSPGMQGGNSSNTLNSPVYLIAFRDQTIRAAVAYWVEENTLHYVTLEHESKQTPLDAVDRDLSRQLNSERRVQFSLPAPR
jgi:hypothetical protein